MRADCFFTVRYERGLEPRSKAIGKCINEIIDASELNTFVVYSPEKDILRHIAVRPGYVQTTPRTLRWDGEGCIVRLYHEDGISGVQPFPEDTCVIVDVRDNFPTLDFFLNSLGRVCYPKEAEVRLIAEANETVEFNEDEW